MKGGRNMMQYIILLVFGIIAIIISFATQNLNRKPTYVNNAYGSITKVVFSDTGNVCYYINIDNGKGQILEAQSNYYSKTNNKYHVNDVVSVSYYYADNQKVRCDVNDHELIPVKTSFKIMSKVTFIIGVIFIVLFLLFTIKNYI